MSRLYGPLLLLSLAACGTSRGNDFAVDVQSAADTAVDDSSPADDVAPVTDDVPVVVDAGVTVDVPVLADTPLAIDVPVGVDVRPPVDVPRTDVPAVDAGVAVDSSGVHCATGFGDCNGVASDGCETNTQSDRAHCGGCATVCPATLSCVSSACACLFGGTNCGGTCVDTNSNPAHCGGCGVACSTTCAGGVCTGGSLTCDAVTYDVNGLVADGCEASDDTNAGHTQATATALSPQDCSDSTTGSFSGRIVSDSRSHSPQPAGFVAAVGAAPDWYRVRATGGLLCALNYGITITTMGGSSATSCYLLTFVTDRSNVTLAVSGSGTNTTSSGAFGLYTANTDLLFRVEKTCSLPTQENVSYTVTFHL